MKYLSFHITFTFKNVAYDIFAFTYKDKKYNLNTGCNSIDGADALLMILMKIIETCMSSQIL